MRKLLIIPLILILTLTLVQAEIKITHEAQQDSVGIGETATFIIKVENRGSGQETIRLEPVQQYGKWRVETPDPYILDIPAGNVRESELRITPLSKISVGTYNQKIIIKDFKDNVLQEILIPVKIGPFDYAVNTQLIMPEAIDPRDSPTIKVMVENLYPYDLINLDLELSSSIYKESQKIDLLGNEKVIKEFRFSVDPTVKAGDYIVTATVKNKAAVVGKDAQRISLSQFSDVTEKTIKEEGLFSTTITVEKTNEGNSKAAGKTVFRMTAFQKLFSSYNIKPTEVTNQEGQYVYVWDFVLEPGDSYIVSVKTNYGVLFLGVLILLAIIFMGHHLLSKKITITKKVMEVKKTKDGISGMKIMLHIKNKSAGNFNKVKIVDYLPKLVAPSKDFGTIKPTNVQRSASGSIRVIWDIPRLERGEERIISYKIRSKLSIIGRFGLPSAVVEYRNKKGRLVRIHSNRLTLLIPEEKDNE